MAIEYVFIDDDPSGVELRGAVLKAWKSKAPEILLAGPAETGKTYGGLYKFDALLSLFPNSHGLILRKTLKSCYSTVIKTYTDKILGDRFNSDVIPYGGKKPEWFDYSNGSRVVVGGMDNPDKVLSGEYDFIYVCQAEELTIDEYEPLTSRATGRAGNSPYPQIIMDCNPGSDKHWLLHRVKSGALVMFESRHEDNPVLFQNGEWTEQGKKTLSRLDRLTGRRKQRLRFGKWVGAEGLVYELFDKRIHMTPRFEIPENWYRYISVDWGYRDPMVIQWWATNGEYAVLYREIYTTGKRVDIVGDQAGALSKGEKIEFAVTDHDPDKQERFEEAFNDASGDNPKIVCYNATKEIENGVHVVEGLLEQDPDGKPFICFMEDTLVEMDESLMEDFLPTCTVDEFDSYAYPKDESGKPRKERPKDKDNHGMDAMRYFCMEWSQIRKGPILATVTT